jgi:cell division protein FtsQ
VDGTSEAGAPSRRSRTIRLAAAGVVLILGASWAAIQGWRSLSRAEALRIRDVRFTGLRHATADELIALSSVKVGDPLLLSDLAAMKVGLARHPWVRSVEVRRSLPPAVVVAVRERTAVALVDLGGLYLVDDEANVFKRAAAGDGLDLPVVTGIGRNDYVQRPAAVDPLLRGALALVRAWRDQDRDPATRISEIHLDPGEGTTLYLGREGTQVRLGSGDLPAKLARAEKVLSLLRSEGKKADVLHLDNRVHPSWVTVRLAASEQGKDGYR